MALDQFVLILAFNNWIVNNWTVVVFFVLFFTLQLHGKPQPVSFVITSLISSFPVANKQPRWLETDSSLHPLCHAYTHSDLVSDWLVGRKRILRHEYSSNTPTNTAASRVHVVDYISQTERRFSASTVLERQP